MDDDEAAVLRRILTPQAWARLGQIEREHPERKEKIEKQLLALARAGSPDHRKT